jgi:hypothetical protein
LALGTFPTEQVGQRGNAGAVAAPAEGATSLQIGERGDARLIDGATRALADGQHTEQIGLARRRPCRLPQRLHRLGEQRLATSIGASDTPRFYQNTCSKEGSFSASRTDRTRFRFGRGPSG